MNFISALCITALVFPFAAPAKGQTGPPAGQNRYEVTMTPRTILAINYENKKVTEIGFEGSPLMPLGKGHAVVESKNGRIAINAQFEHMETPEKFGPEYLTYVLWGVTPEGKANSAAATPVPRSLCGWIDSTAQSRCARCRANHSI